MKSCTICRVNKDYSKFNKDSKSKDGYFGYCKICRKELDRRYYLNSNKKNKIYEYRAKVDETRNKMKEGRGCIYCNETDVVCLDFHHLNPKEKLINISQIESLPMLLKESKKCILVCANCHRKLHAGRNLMPRLEDYSTDSTKVS
jgi:hypothetical protein